MGTRRWHWLVLWWLVPVVGLALVLWTSYAALTERRSDDINGVPGELLAGHSFGQSFAARYAGLSGVELRVGTYRQGAGPARATLVLHLRSVPGRGPDIATARLEKGTRLDENPWYLFSFPPIAASQDKPFYVQIESPDGLPGHALTLFWWRPPVVGDAYAGGTAYRDQKAERADFAFGLRYSASPVSAWAQLARAASANFPTALMAGIDLIVALGAVWVVLQLPGVLRDPTRRALWVVRWSLPVALSVALVNGVVYLTLAPPWQGPDEHSHFVYVALLDKYGMDNSKVQRLQFGANAADPLLAGAISESMNQHEFTRRILGDATPGALVSPGIGFYQQLRQPPLYYWLGAAAMRAVRAVGVPADPYRDPGGALLVVRAVSLLLSLGVVFLAWLAGVLLDMGGGGPVRLLRLLSPLTVILLPMHTFIASVANNDILAELDVSALFVALVALARWPFGARGLVLALLAAMVTGVGAWTKSTALAASVPLLTLGLLVWCGALVTRAFVGRTGGLGGRARAGWTWPLAVVASLVALGSVCVVLAYQRDDGVAGWQTNYVPIERAPRARTASAHDGSYVIRLGVGGEAGEGATATQSLVPPVYHPALRVTFSGWARRPSEIAVRGSSPVTASLQILESGWRVLGSEVASLDRAGEWIKLVATSRVPESAEQIDLKLVSGGGVVEFDDLSLNAVTPSGPWNDPVFRPTLLNPSAETDGTTLRPLLRRFLPIDAGQIADAIANPQPFNENALWEQFADGQYRSFLGDFGWLSVPLPSVLYMALGLLTVAGLVGLGYLGIHHWGKWSGIEWLGAISLLALSAATAIGFAKQMTLLATQGNASYPQGRYLFVLSIPVAWLLLCGLWSLCVRVGRVVSLVRERVAMRSDIRVRRNSPGLVAWGVWLWINALLVFSGYCVLGLIAPYYYG